MDPTHIRDFLALVGDNADGYPGIPKIGPKTAAQLINRYGTIEEFPDDVLRVNREAALLFKKLATLRTDLPLFKDIEELQWAGPLPTFSSWTEQLADPKLQARVKELHAIRS